MLRRRASALVVGLFVILLATDSVSAHSSSATPSKINRQHGLIGYGISMYDPPCAYACQEIISAARLSCSTTDDDHHDRRRHGGGGGGDHEDEEERYSTSSECYATDDAYLMSLAWCIKLRCLQDSNTHVKQWEVERFWESNAVPGGAHEPKYSYDVAMIMCGRGPVKKYEAGKVVDAPAWWPDEEYDPIEGHHRDFARVEEQHSRYGIVLVAFMLLFPLALTFWHFLIASFWPRGERLLLAYVVDPALYGKRHLVSLPMSIGLAPTRGQALLILAITAVNALLSVVTYRGGPLPNGSYDSTREALASYFSNRQAILCVANLSVLLLFSGRNNPLIALTGWSRGTFLLLHRWVAYICVFQGALHSGIKFLSHLDVIWHKLTQAYWIAGSATMLVIILIVPLSLLPLRRRWYELFLDVHIVFAALVLVGAYLHLNIEFSYRWGYENWVVLAAFVWVAERVVRMIKVASNGVREATVEIIDHEYCQVSVEGVSATGHAYLYFPQGRWRLWENHPFSIAKSVVPSSRGGGKGRHRLLASGHQPLAGHEMFELGSDVSSERDSSESKRDKAVRTSSDSDDAGGAGNAEFEMESMPPAAAIDAASGSGAKESSSQPLLQREDDDNNDYENTPEEDSHEKPGDATALFPSDNPSTTGLTFLIRRNRGLTRRLFNNNNTQAAIKVLVEAPYASSSSPATTPRYLSTSAAHVVCIAGGSGITALLPLLRARASAGLGRTALYFSSRSEELVRASGVAEMRGRGVEVNVRTGRRWDVGHVVAREVGGGYGDDDAGDVVVVSCGPAGMADDVRWEVVRANRRIQGSRVVRLVEECYSW